MNRMLLVVDVQNGFVNQFTDTIPGRIRTLVERGRFDPVLFTRFVNTPESPYRRLLDWHTGAEPPDTDIAPELADLVAAGAAYTTGLDEGYLGRPPVEDEKPEAVLARGADGR